MQAHLTNVDVAAAPIASYRSLLPEKTWQAFASSMSGLAAAMKGRVLWNVNSTARGGGVAELLTSLIPYDLGAGIDERWVVIEGSPAFFNFTKRMHNLLHGVASDGTEITAAEKQEYQHTLGRNVRALVQVVRRGDVVVIHDPQAAGLVPPLVEHGAHVVWRSHVGIDRPNDAAREAWDLLRPYLDPAAALIFSRATYVWEGLKADRVHIIAPTIDPFTAKNQEMADGEVMSILQKADIAEGRPGSTNGRITRQAVRTGSRIPGGACVVLQVSRWDELKDPLGVLQGFAFHVAPRSSSWLVLAGPGASSVRDDPEQPEVLHHVLARVSELPADVAARVQIAQLPMDDVEENALIVNALQRRADVVIQKSLAEGFGLTVAEAMWKARPVVASRVGGIEDQIEDGKSGILIDDPRDLEAFGEAVIRLERDSEMARRLGAVARQRVVDQFLAPRHLQQQAELILGIIAA